MHVLLLLYFVNQLMTLVQKSCMLCQQYCCARFSADLVGAGVVVVGACVAAFGAKTFFIVVVLVPGLDATGFASSALTCSVLAFAGLEGGDLVGWGFAGFCLVGFCLALFGFCSGLGWSERGALIGGSDLACSGLGWSCLAAVVCGFNGLCPTAAKAPVVKTIWDSSDAFLHMVGLRLCGPWQAFFNLRSSHMICVKKWRGLVL